MGGTHTVDLIIPGYTSEQRTFAIQGAGVVSLGEILLEQSGLPFYSSILELELFLHPSTSTENGIEYIVEADINSKLIDSNLINIKWTVESGKINSTSGKCISWFIEKDVPFDSQAITATAYVPGYGKIKNSMILSSTEIPEFSFISTTIIFSLFFAILILFIQKKQMKARLPEMSNS